MVLKQEKSGLQGTQLSSTPTTAKKLFNAQNLARKPLKRFLVFWFCVLKVEMASIENFSVLFFLKRSW